MSDANLNKLMLKSLAVDASKYLMGVNKEKDPLSGTAPER